MKENAAKGCMYVIILFAVLVGFPGYFQLHPDYRFFWNVCAVLGAGVQMFLLIAGGKEKRMGHLKMVLALLLSVVMANGYYSFDALSVAFPFLGRLTEGSLFALGILAIAVSAACGGMCLAWSAYREKQGQAGAPPSLRHIIGTVAVVAGIVVLAAVIIYALCRNQEFLLALTNQGLPYLVFNFMTGFGIVLAAVFVITVLIFYFIQMCSSIIREMLQHRRLDMKNDAFLKCVSVFITMSGVFFCWDAAILDLFTLTAGGNEAASLLAAVMAFTLFAWIALMVYKILQSFAHPDGMMREYANKSFRLVVTAAGDMVIHILEMVSKAPDALWELLFDMDEDDFGDLNHL